MTTASESLHFDYCPIKREANPRFVSTIARNTYALVLAGGRGSRLEQLTDWRAENCASSTFHFPTALIRESGASAS